MSVLLTVRELLQQEVEVAYLREELRLGVRGRGTPGHTASEVSDTLGRKREGGREEAVKKKRRERKER